VRILCLNAWGGKLHDALITYLRAASPDILCLQEVTHSPASGKEWLTYRDGAHVLDQRANLFRDIADALPDHIGQFCPAAQGLLWDDDVPVPSQWGLATFIRRTLPIIGQVQGFVHKSYGADGFGDHPRSRNAHGIRVWDHDRARAVVVAHMHGLRDPGDKGDSPERLAQAGRFAALIASLAEPGDDVVACGDFNVLPGSATFKVLAGIGLHDLVTGRGHAGTRSSLYAKPGRFADYMAVGDAVPVARFDVVRSPEVSDHCPLMLEIGAANTAIRSQSGDVVPSDA
jgi:endonuclease/exonuclease/phosphatase family metal-dependent hydrolase